MSHRTSNWIDARRLAGAAGLGLVFATSACRAVPPEAVPECPHCRSPRTFVGADGHEHVRTRLRLRDALPDVTLGLGPWALERDDEPER